MATKQLNSEQAAQIDFRVLFEKTISMLLKVYILCYFGPLRSNVINFILKVFKLSQIGRVLNGHLQY